VSLVALASTRAPTMVDSRASATLPILSWIPGGLKGDQNTDESPQARQIGTLTGLPSGSRATSSPTRTGQPLPAKPRLRDERYPSTKAVSADLGSLVPEIRSFQRSTASSNALVHATVASASLDSKWP